MKVHMTGETNVRNVFNSINISDFSKHFTLFHWSFDLMMLRSCGPREQMTSSANNWVIQVKTIASLLFNMSLVKS